MMDYSKTKEFESKARELVKELLLFCDINKVPAFMAFAVEEKNGKTTYVREIITPGALDIQVTDDEIYKHALVANGFNVVPENSGPPDIDF